MPQIWIFSNFDGFRWRCSSLLEWPSSLTKGLYILESQWLRWRSCNLESDARRFHHSKRLETQDILSLCADRTSINLPSLPEFMLPGLLSEAIAGKDSSKAGLWQRSYMKLLIITILKHGSKWKLLLGLLELTGLWGFRCIVLFVGGKFFELPTMVYFWTTKDQITSVKNELAVSEFNFKSVIMVFQVLTFDPIELFRYFLN